MEHQIEVLLHQIVHHQSSRTRFSVVKVGLKPFQDLSSKTKETAQSIEEFEKFSINLELIYRRVGEVDNTRF